METQNAFQNPVDKKPEATLLVVDDDSSQHDLVDLLLAEQCADLQITVLHAHTLPNAYKILSENRVHAILLDKDVGTAPVDVSQDGIEAIPRILNLQPHARIIVVTGHDPKDRQAIVRAMNYGASEYVIKPEQRELLAGLVPKAIREAKAALAGAIDRSSKPQPNDRVQLAGKSRAFRHVMRQLPGLAESSRSALLLGESGSGKTAIAREIHLQRQNYLGQKERPFVAVNGKALSETTIESRLFGHEKGAFTGADSVQQGIFELAHGGTVFFDEIGEISSDLQVKLLKVIEEGRFYRMGGKTELRSDFKFVCATNRDLEEMVEKGLFREDLYMRIATFVLKIPSLEERKEDIPEIIKALLPRIGKDSRASIRFEDLPSDFIQELSNNIPRGNIRGIERVLEQLVVFAPRDRRGRPVLKNWREIEFVDFGKSASRAANRDTLTMAEFRNLPLDVVGDPDFQGLQEFMDLIERKVMIDARQKTGGGTVKMAEALGVLASLASNRKKKYKIEKLPKKGVLLTSSKMIVSAPRGEANR